MNRRQAISILLCGWVLWSGTTKFLSFVGEWEILGAFETGNACEQEAKSRRDDFWKVTNEQGRRGALAGVGGYIVTHPGFPPTL
jgi:hypothetical protein